MYRQTQSLYRRISYRVLEQLQGHRRFVLVTPQRILLVQQELLHQELLLTDGSVKRLLPIQQQIRGLQQVSIVRLILSQERYQRPHVLDV